ncbi:MAG TPA: MBL fold metallo-hydrolase [Dehalococcoidia bacterium]|nr:MBL fold metallo-hydrolase [Dehalococcoidia bacterium]
MTMTINRPETRIDVSAFAPPPPRFHHEPLKIAPDTYLIRQLHGEGEAPMLAYFNSLVVLGEQPAIIDTGAVNNRENWLNDVFSLVDPKDVRWVFISHDDHDHVGNLPEVMALCPNATLVSSWFQVERLGGDLALPLGRMRWVGDGESFNAGDRVFAAIRPPLYDSPTTRGLYDSKTGVYWASDCFATPVTQAMDEVSGMHPEEWRQGFTVFNVANSPWVSIVDPVKFNCGVEQLAKLGISAIASAHTPAILGANVSTAIDMLYDLPGSSMPELPGQETLEAMVAQISGLAK